MAAINRRMIKSASRIDDAPESVEDTYRSHEDDPAVSKYPKKALQPMKDNAISILTRSSLHGFSCIWSKESPWALKLFWIACLACSWSYFGYQAYSTVILYESFPKVTLISKVSETVLDFPGRIAV